MAKPSADACLEDISKYRELILAQSWAEGISPDEVRSYLDGLPIERFPHYAYSKRPGRPLIQPRGGVPIFEKQRELTKILHAAGADFLPLTIDSYTRHNEYEVATQLLRRSEDEDINYLNGYPLVSHGYELTRELYQGLDRPVSLRHGTPDARLLVEIAIAAGITEIEGGGLCYCLPYSEGFPLDRSLLYWQYVDRICALNSTVQRPIHRESFGPLTATLVPPAMVISIEILEALLAAEQGVSSFAVSFGQMGSITQDIATARVLRRLLREYLAEFGFEAMDTYLIFHQWMGQFPYERVKASALITTSALLANLIDADKVVVKTVDEALGVPDAESNAEAVEAVHYISRTFKMSGELYSDEINLEVSIIEAEVRSILRAIFELPGDVFWESVYRAFQLGILDVPFSPHADNPNRLITMRDKAGSIRIKDPGAVPIGPGMMAQEDELLRSALGESGGTYQHMLNDIRVMV